MSFESFLVCNNVEPRLAFSLSNEGWLFVGTFCHLRDLPQLLVIAVVNAVKDVLGTANRRRRDWEGL